MAKAKVKEQPSDNGAVKRKAGQPQKWTDEAIEKEADFLLEWSCEDDSLVLATCYGMRGYSYQRAEEWDSSNSKFSEAKKIAKTIIGARREHGAIIGKLDSSIVKASLANYDPEYRKLMIDMKVANSASNVPKSVVFTFSGREENVPIVSE